VTSGSPTPEPVTSSLDDAIRTAPVKQIHSLLILICQKHESARKLASSRLLAPMESSTGRKRKAFEKCKHCGVDYSVLSNEKGDCMYHPGKLGPPRATKLLRTVPNFEIQGRRKRTSKVTIGLIMTSLVMDVYTISLMIQRTKTVSNGPAVRG
jgi:hypothetical protein